MIYLHHLESIFYIPVQLVLQFLEVVVHPPLILLGL